MVYSGRAGPVPTAPMSTLPPGKSQSPDPDAPGVPGFRTWRGVYAFVFGAFVVLVILLALFSRFTA